MAKPRFVPLEERVERRLPPEDPANADDPARAVVFAFRPRNPDPIVVTAAAERRETDPEEGQGTVTVGGRIRIYRPGATMPVVDRFALIVEHPVEPEDMALQGDWRAVVTNPGWPPRALDYSVHLAYPGDLPLIALPLSVSFLNDVVAEKIRQLEPRLTIDTGRWTTVRGETANLAPGEELAFSLDPPGEEGDTVRIAVRGTEIVPRPRPGDPDWRPPRDDHGGIVVAEPGSAPRRVRIFRPGRAEPLVDVTESPAIAVTVTEYEVQPGDLGSPGPWRAVVSNPAASETYRYTIGRLVAHGSSRLEFGEAASQQSGLKPFTFPIAPFKGAINIRDLKSERIAVVFRGAEPAFPDGSLTLSLGFEHQGVEVHVNDFDFGEVFGLELDTGGVADLANIAASIRLGFAVADGGLAFGRHDVDFDFVVRWFTVIPEDLDDLVFFLIGVIVQALHWLLGGGRDFESLLEDLLQGALRGIANDVLDKELGDAAADPRMTLRKLLAKTVRDGLVLQLPEGIRFYSVAADADTITFQYYFPRPPDPPRGRIRWPRSPGLERIDHLVVMMMENRSFDHLLGWLYREGRRDVDGLRGSEVNRLGDVAYRVEPMPGTYFPYDPPHHWQDRDVQMGPNGRMDGFVASFAADNPGVDPGWVMRYHLSSQVPVYRELIARYMVADRWFSSLPAHTAINRLYYLAGESAGYDHPPAPLFLYDVQAVFRHLGDEDWIYYYHNVPSLWLCSGYTGTHPNVRRFEGGTASPRDPGFLARARNGTLPKVTFVDPRLKGIIDDTPPNDDHPEGDVTWGQRLVGEMYNALIASERWAKTLFLLIYDEHGGFHDHRRPPTAAADDVPRFRRYGPRVPALILSPLVPEASVSHEIYDHTTVAKTILSRFCRRGPDDDTIPSMTARVDAAKDVGAMLTLARPRAAQPVAIPPEPPPPPEDLLPAEPRPPAPDDFRTWVTLMERPSSALVPRPLVGYAAPGLCFDRLRGRAGTRGPTFLKRLRAGRWPVNLTRVVLFRRSTAEGLPAERALPLYAGGALSAAFKRNLKALVAEASGAVPRFYVQVCLFSYAAVRNVAETPEALPAELRPAFGRSIRTRLQRWFDPTPGRRLEAQKRFVREIGETLRGFDNVLWELADQVRIDGRGSTAEDQCALLDWLHVMRRELVAVVGDRALVTTSTAPASEALVFGHRRAPCRNRPLPAGFFDLHPVEWRLEGDLEGGIARAVARANGYQPAAFVILSDDGLGPPGTASPRLETWARAAFRAGAGFTMRAPVPPVQPLDRAALEALADAYASRAVPREHSYLVLYELARGRAARYRALQQAIARFADVCHLESSAWIFTTPLQLGEVTSLLDRAVEHDDSLVVLALDGARLDGRVPDERVREWFQRRLGVALRPPRRPSPIE